MMKYRTFSLLPSEGALRSRRGFNLIELLVVMGMIGILAGIFLANVKQFTMNYHMAGAASQFQEDLVGAQGEAVNQDAWVVMEFDLTDNRYRFWKSVVVQNPDGSTEEGPLTLFDIRTGDPPSAAGKEWRYTTVSKTDATGEQRVVFGDITNIGGGTRASGGVTVTGDLLCFAPRTGRVDNCGASGASLAASVILIPDKAYYDRRFSGYTYDTSGEMDRPGHTRRVEISYNGDFIFKRWDKANTQWVQ